MRAIVRHRHEKKAVSLEDVPKQSCGPEEVLLNVRAAGICGSDVSAYLGKSTYDYMDVPAVLGHECAGVIADVGDRVSRVSVGDRVVLKPGDPCGDCFHCLIGEPNNCPDREPAVAEGGFSPYTVTRPDHVITIPESITMTRAAITEPLAVTHRAVTTQGKVSPGDYVLVQGPGPMGAFSALVAQSAGADVVVSGLESDASRLDFLEETGVDTVINPFTDNQSASEFARKYTERGGFDVTIDATGVAPALNTSIEATRNGGAVVVLGIIPDAVSVEMSDLVRSEVDLRTSHGSTTEDFLRALALLDSPDPLPVDALIDTSYSPNKPHDAFEAFIDAKVIKPVFDITELAE